MSNQANNSIRAAAITLGVSEEVLMSALPMLKSGKYDPLLGHEYAHPASALADYIQEQYRLLRGMRIENVELKAELRKFKEPDAGAETITIPAMVWRDVLIKSEKNNG